MKRLMKNVLQQPPLCVLRFFAAKTPRSPLSVSQFAILNPRSTIRDPLSAVASAKEERSALGFTLIEVMVALTVVTMGIVAVLGLIPVGLKSARDAKDNTQAATIVQDVFASVRSSFMTYPTNTPPTLSSSVYLDTITGSTVLSNTALFDITGSQTNAVGPDSYYRIDLTYQQPDSVSGLPLYRVTAVVTWPVHTSGVTASSLPGNTFVTEVAQYQ